MPNPANDASATVGHRLFRCCEFAHRRPRNAARNSNFTERTKDADVAIIYYADHGMKVGGVDFLGPTDAILCGGTSTLRIKRSHVTAVAGAGACKGPCGSLFEGVGPHARSFTVSKAAHASPRRAGCGSAKSSKSGPCSYRLVSACVVRAPSNVVLRNSNKFRAPCIVPISREHPTSQFFGSRLID